MTISPKTLQTITNESSYYVVSEICTTIRLMVEDAGMDAKNREMVTEACDELLREVAHKEMRR
jgi:hypothetical protein